MGWARTEVLGWGFTIPVGSHLEACPGKEGQGCAECPGQTLSPDCLIRGRAGDEDIFAQGHFYPQPGSFWTTEEVSGQRAWFQTPSPAKDTVRSKNSIKERK